MLLKSDHSKKPTREVYEYVEIKTLEYFDSYLNNQFSVKNLAEIANKNGYSFERQEIDLHEIKLNSDENLQKSSASLTNKSLLTEIDAKSPSYILEMMREAGIKAGYFAGAAAALAAAY